MIFAGKKQSYLSCTASGQICAVHSKGNDCLCMVSRGGHAGSNYDERDIDEAVKLMQKNSIHPSIVVDCSHANSNKKPEQQQLVAEEIIRQHNQENSALIGLMLESFLKNGQQKTAPLSKLEYGQSITDAYISIGETEGLLQKLYNKIKVH